MKKYCSLARLFAYWLVIAQIYSLVSSQDATRDYFDAKLRLVNYLTNGSDLLKEILPAKDINTPVDVKLLIKLRQIATVDQKNQAIRLNVWFNFSWNNPFLRWDPEEYQGIESVHANHELFWVPDVALFNEASLEEEIDILYKRLPTKLVINKDGDCIWNAPATLLSQCKIDVSKFPFDEQKCHVTIGSWTYSGYKINITYYDHQADLSNFIPNGQWEVQSALLYNRFRKYGVAKIPYPDVTLTLIIRRKPLYYGMNIVIPCALISLLALFSFILPSDHGERMSLVITVLLALSVYMLIVSSALPETSDSVPVLGIYCLGIIVTIALCLCGTCVTLKFRDCNTPIPPWLEGLAEKMGKYVFVKFEETIDLESDDGISISLNNQKFTTIEEPKATLQNGQEAHTEDIALIKMEEKQTTSFDDSLLEEVRLLTDELRCRQTEEEFGKKWKIAAKVLDRYFLLIFILIYLCLFFYLLSAM